MPKYYQIEPEKISEIERMLLQLSTQLEITGEIYPNALATANKELAILCVEKIEAILQTVLAAPVMSITDTLIAEFDEFDTSNIDIESVAAAVEDGMDTYQHIERAIESLVRRQQWHNEQPTLPARGNREYSIWYTYQDTSVELPAVVDNVNHAQREVVLLIDGVHQEFLRNIRNAFQDYHQAIDTFTVQAIENLKNGDTLTHVGIGDYAFHVSLEIIGGSADE